MRRTPLIDAVPARVIDGSATLTIEKSSKAGFRVGMLLLPRLVRRLRGADVVIRRALEALDVADPDVAVSCLPRLGALLAKLAAILGARRARGAARRADVPGGLEFVLHVARRALRENRFTRTNHTHFILPDRSGRRLESRRSSSRIRTPRANAGRGSTGRDAGRKMTTRPGIGGDSARRSATRFMEPSLSKRRASRCADCTPRRSRNSRTSAPYAVGGSAQCRAVGMRRFACWCAHSRRMVRRCRVR